MAASSSFVAFALVVSGTSVSRPGSSARGETTSWCEAGGATTGAGCAVADVSVRRSAGAVGGASARVVALVAILVGCVAVSATGGTVSVGGGSDGRHGATIWTRTGATIVSAAVLSESDSGSASVAVSGRADGSLRTSLSAGSGPDATTTCGTSPVSINQVPVGTSANPRPVGHAHPPSPPLGSVGADSADPASADCASASAVANSDPSSGRPSLTAVDATAASRGAAMNSTEATGYRFRLRVSWSISSATVIPFAEAW